jgi:putative acetyltransferase
MAEREAAAAGAHFIELWTDTRFADAHRLYERRDYIRGAETRELNDVSRSVEFYFRKQITGSPGRALGSEPLRR